MKIRHPFVHGVALLTLAFIFAIVTNGFASRQRKLILPGFYPNALEVPPRQPDPVPFTPAAAAPVTTTAQSPAPGQPPIELTSTAAAASETSAAVTITSPAPPATVTSAAPPAAPAVKPPATAEDPLHRFPPHPDKASVDISGEDAAWLHARGTLFLDARRTSVYEEGHIAGARSFSVWESDIDQKVSGLFNERMSPSDQNLPIVIYCSGGACEDSHMLAQKLWGVQFNNVYVYKDGYPDWQKRGGATRAGGQP